MTKHARQELECVRCKGATREECERVLAKFDAGFPAEHVHAVSLADALRASLAREAAARDAALEEAAEACDWSPGHTPAEAARYCADIIRALKSEPAR